MLNMVIRKTFSIGEDLNEQIFGSYSGNISRRIEYLLFKGYHADITGEEELVKILNEKEATIIRLREEINKLENKLKKKKPTGVPDFVPITIG